MEHVHVSGREVPDPNSDEIIPTEEIEVGMGIHNGESVTHTAFVHGRVMMS
jgi:hypothetical protein